jgi:uncharacterized protein (UPF0305 family)
MAENILDTGFEDVMKSSLTLKKNLRILIANLSNSHDEEISGKFIKGVDQILEKKIEYSQDLQEVISLCDELKNKMDKLDNTRANKGRKF